MKKEYVTPMMVGERFTPNEYVAACGDENKVYQFVCDASTKWGTGLTGSTVYTNGEDGIMGTQDDESLGPYGACSKTHEASTTDDFIQGYLRKNFLGVPVGDPMPVIIWRGEDGKNIHCTTNLNMETWVTSKS
ncbi:MAG: hypothetical protein ACI4EY_03505 [Lachnospiraceae bacterium]